MTVLNERPSVKFHIKLKSDTKKDLPSDVNYLQDSPFEFLLVQTPLLFRQMSTLQMTFPVF